MLVSASHVLLANMKWYSSLVALSSSHILYFMLHQLHGRLDYNGSFFNKFSFTTTDLLELLDCNLRVLGLQSNSLKGILPASVATLYQLQTLNLGYNQLTGR